jgi:hypothetical protein
MPRDMTVAEYLAIDCRHRSALDTLERYSFPADPPASYTIVGFVGKPCALDPDGVPTAYRGVALRALEFTQDATL